MSDTNFNARLEAFCDAVFAIALTLLVIDIKIPATMEINNTREFWLALEHIIPSILAFVLSFTIILITWFNHHASVKLVNRSSSAFIFANGFLLITVVFIPFPTSLMGEHILTDHAAPAVILYNSTLALQAIGWILLTSTAINGKLYKSEKSAMTLSQNRRYGYFAFLLYTVSAIAANWVPFTIAIITTLIWIFWLILGLSIKNE